MTGRRALILASCGAIAFGGLSAHAFAPRDLPSPPGDSFSPLFARRLEAGVQNMDRPTGRVRIAGRLVIADPVETPASANPISVCVVSGCALSICLGSGCIFSGCIGSACEGSACLGSTCIGSGCGGSACLGSVCLGSVCAGSGCLGSVCATCPAEPEPGETQALEPGDGGAA